MLYGNNYFHQNNPYAQRLNALEQQAMFSQPTIPAQPQAQPIQNLNQLQQPQALCCLVNQVNDINNISPMPNTYYLGLNLANKEIYLKHLTNDGITSIETYSLASDRQEKGTLQVIAERLDIIENKLNALPLPNPNAVPNAVPNQIPVKEKNNAYAVNTTNATNGKTTNDQF